MTSVRRLGTVTLFAPALCAGLLGVACRGDREKPPPSPGTTAPAATAVSPAADTASVVQWDTAAGRGLVLSMGAAGDSAMIVRPEYTDGHFDGWRPEDVRPFAHSRWDLFGRSGAFGSVQIDPTTKAASAKECTTWPSASVSVARAGWRTALESGHATAVSLDSVEALSSQDSSLFVIEVTRLAASTHGPDDSLFASIPFVVRNAFRFRTGDIEGVIASLQRSIHSEADPREEHLFLIAERPVGSTGAYRVGYTTRAAGSEGGAPVTDVLAMVTVSASRRLALIASHEYEDGGEIWWIERIAPGRWRSTWRSAATGC